MSRDYNIAGELLRRNLPTRANKIAFIDDTSECTFAELDRRARAFAGYLTALGLSIETRVMLVMEDSIAFPVACLGTIMAGLVPVMVNPLLTSSDLEYLIDDSRAQVLIASPAAWPKLAEVASGRPFLRHILVDSQEPPVCTRSLSDATTYVEPILAPAPTRRDDACLWQYSSGSTGRPKGTIHTHGALADLLDLYPREILDLRQDDVTFSAAKLFFGYGFGNGLVFPLAAGATAILMAERPTPAAVWARLVRHRPTIFFGVPTLYNSMLSFPDQPPAGNLALRICTSAGEALPIEIGRRWEDRFGIAILDGIGSTEMLHIFLSNRLDDNSYGTTGRPLQGYEIRLVDDEGRPVTPGEIGELHVSGPTSAAGYWCNRDKTQQTFLGRWVRSGDKFRQNDDGRYVFCGRGDDMLKVGGIYVSPNEVEDAILSHPAVMEVAVIGCCDDAGLIKPKAFVVLAEASASEDIADILKLHVKARLAPYKYPRWIEFVESLPKTASGKIARYHLRSGTGV